MNRVLRIAGILSLALFTSCASAEFDSAGLTQTLETAQAETKTVGFALGVIKDGDLVYARGFGVKTLGEDAPVDADTNFHWASVSKPFVATAIMQLSERDALDLDARLIDILPDYRITDERQREITIRQILLHTSGLPDVEDYEWDKPQYDAEALRRWALEESPRELLHDPGTAREYSNIGFEILGAVIERVSGLSFADYMAQNIFTPLKMTHTTFYYPDTDPARRSAGHAGEAGAKHQIAAYPYNRRHEPSSTLNTSINEIARFALALLNGGELGSARILDEETMRDMWAPRWTMGDDPLHAGTMGWVYQERERVVMLRHFGGDDGYRSAFILMPEIKSAILFVTNDEEAPQRDIILAALAALTGSEENNQTSKSKN